MTTITLVKKIKADGSPCAKCRDVLERLQHDGVAGHIDRIVTADERDTASEGMRLAERYKVERAPFFIVERAGEPPQIYTVYMHLLRDVLEQQEDEREEAVELMDAGGLDFI